MSRPTIHDVAARAGVSKSTVSLVLQDSPLVKEGKRTAVQRAMADLGYVYNAAAAGLRGRVQVPAQPNTAAGNTVPLATDLAHPSHAAFAAALQQGAVAKGLGLLLLPHGQPWQGRRISTFGEDQADAQTITALHPRAMVRALDGLAAARATRHLLGLGAGGVAFVGGDPAQEADSLRIRGYQQRMAKAGLSPLHLAGGHDAAFGRRAMTKLLSMHPECNSALCISDQVALGMAEVLADRGLALGSKFSLVGWGDSPAAQAAGLSSIGAPWAAMAGFCLNWIETGEGSGIEVEPPLVRRASSMGGA